MIYPWSKFVADGTTPRVAIPIVDAVIAPILHRSRVLLTYKRRPIPNAIFEGAAATSIPGEQL